MKSRFTRLSCCSATDENIARHGTDAECRYYQRLITYLHEFYEYEHGRKWGGTNFSKEAELLAALDHFCTEFQ